MQVTVLRYRPKKISELTILQDATKVQFQQSAYRHSTLNSRPACAPAEWWAGHCGVRKPEIHRNSHRAIAVFPAGKK